MVLPVIITILNVLLAVEKILKVAIKRSAKHFSCNNE